MSLLQSGRPETSVPESSQPSLSPKQSSDEPKQAQSSEQTSVGIVEDPSDSPFVPHIFDFITIASHMANVAQYDIMPMYLEAHAVDSSILIGHGASFTASVHAIPSEKQVHLVPRKHDGMEYLPVQPPTRKARSVVYKTARIAFSRLGEPLPKDKRAMSSAMMELYALVHAPLSKHENIVKLIGLAWGSNPYDPSHRLPVPIVEYADHGTLDDLQMTEQLDSEEKRRLCLDVALGIDVLHGSGLVHGDVKSENVLVFIGEGRKYIAKIADFGFSVIEAAASVNLHIGGTRPWKAPEAAGTVARANLKATDVYSLGLLIWRVAADGESPFKFSLPLNLASDQYYTQIQQLKEYDTLRSLSKIESWYPSYYIKKTRHKATDLRQLPRLVSQLQEYMQQIRTDQPPSLQDLDSVLERVIGTFSSLSPETKSVDPILMQRANIDGFYSRLDRIMDHSLGKAPETRSLAAVIENLKLDSEVRPTYGPSDVLKRSFDHHVLSWERMRHLEPSVRTYVFESFRIRQQTDEEQGKINPPENFILASFYINGYGTTIDYGEAKRLINFAAINNHAPSEAYAFRIWSALTPNFEATAGLISNLEVSALRGARMAREDLKIAAPGKLASLDQQMRSATAGVGADWFFKHNMLHGLAHWPWQDMLQSRASIAEKLVKVKNKSAFSVNRRGDKILHIAAACGWTEAVEALIDTYSVDVNLQNDQGETALLCACRSGHAHVVRALLGLYADASITTPRGESCLHWLVSFEDEEVEEIGSFLIGSGANIEVQTKDIISYSVFRGSIETDHHKAGPPLTWAVQSQRPDVVRFFLKAAPSASICINKPSDSGLSPLEWAAHFHHTECLKLMCNNLTNAEIAFTYGPLISKSISSADAFSMIIRHGHQFEGKMKQIMEFYIEKCAKTVFTTGVGDFGYTALYLAVVRMSDKIVEYLLSEETKALLVRLHLPKEIPTEGVFHGAHINRSCGADKRTPLLESVRLNRTHIFDLLRSHGADPHATSSNPYYADQENWTALHILAHAAHNPPTPPPLLTKLLEDGLLVDGRPSDAIAPETPLSIALGASALNLSGHFIKHGADINAFSMNSGLIASSYPLTLLGHTCASTSRSALARLKYLLHESEATNTSSLIVDTKRRLTALHRAALAHTDMSFLDPEGGPSRPLKCADVDWGTNRLVLVALLERWGKEADLVLATCEGGKTALHYAVEAGNEEGVRVLLEWDARRLRDVKRSSGSRENSNGRADTSISDIKDESGEQVASLARRLVEAASEGITTKAEILARRRILALLVDPDVD